MPRHARSAQGGVIYHVLNRAAGDRPLFSTNADYEAFVHAIEHAQERIPLRVLGYCLMPDHWHLVLLPKKGEQLSEFIRWLSITHTQRWRAEHHPAAAGHLYESRFRSFPVQPGESLLTLLRFVESNALREGLVKRAEDWKWSSLYRRRDKSAPKLLAEGPAKRPTNWTTLVNRPLKPEELEAAKTSVKRGRPFGTDVWQKRAVKEMDLEFTMRPRGRPRKVVQAQPARKTKRKNMKK